MDLSRLTFRENTPSLFQPQDLGNRLTVLTKAVSQLQSEVTGMQQALGEAGPHWPPNEPASSLAPSPKCTTASRTWDPHS